MLKCLYSAYEKSILTEDEINLIELLGKMKGESYKYITRTKDGGIMLYVGKPTSHYDIYNNWYCYYANTSCFCINKKDNYTMFSNIQFENGIYDIENKCFIKK